MHLTMCPAAYSIIALKTRGWKTVKSVIPPYILQGLKVIIFQTCAGQFVSAWHSATW